MFIKPLFQVKTLVIVVLCLVASACTTHQLVTVSGDPSKIANLETYRWSKVNLTGESSPDDTRELDEAVHQIVNDLLQARGYRLVTEGRADFVMDYRLRISNKIMEVNQEDEMISSRYEQDNIHKHGLQWQFDNSDHVEFSGWKDDQTELVFYREGTIYIGAFKDSLKTGKNNPSFWIKRFSKILEKDEGSEKEKREKLREALELVFSDVPARQ